MTIEALPADGHHETPGVTNHDMPCSVAGGSSSHWGELQHRRVYILGYGVAAAKLSKCDLEGVLADAMPNVLKTSSYKSL